MTAEQLKFMQLKTTWKEDNLIFLAFMTSVCPKPPDAIAARDIEHGPVVDFLLARHTGICCPCGVLL